jgi:hypothetical protein
MIRLARCGRSPCPLPRQLSGVEPACRRLSPTRPPPNCIRANVWNLPIRVTRLRDCVPRTNHPSAHSWSAATGGGACRRHWPRFACSRRCVPGWSSPNGHQNLQLRQRRLEFSYVIWLSPCGERPRRRLTATAKREFSPCNGRLLFDPFSNRGSLSLPDRQVCDQLHCGTTARAQSHDPGYGAGASNCQEIAIGRNSALRISWSFLRIDRAPAPIAGTTR